MNPEETRAAIRLEVEHAERSLRAAQALRGLAMHNDALNRLYYALFHAVSALLLTEGAEARRHSSIPGLLGRHFVLPGRLTAEDVAIFSRAESYRSLADYERTWSATEAICAQAFAEIEPLMGRIRDLLRADGWTDA